MWMNKMLPLSIPAVMSLHGDVNQNYEMDFENWDFLKIFLKGNWKFWKLSEFFEHFSAKYFIYR